jgi:phage baseplate assembly protein W
MTDPGQLYGRGIAFPPRIENGRVAFSAGPDNIRENLEVILLTELGERLFRPGFGAGLEGFLFRPNTVATRRLVQERVEQAVTRWEPRVRLDGVTVAPDPDVPTAAVVEVAYRLVASGAAGRLSLALSLGA